MGLFTAFQRQVRFDFKTMLCFHSAMKLKPSKATTDVRDRVQRLAANVSLGISLPSVEQDLHVPWKLKCHIFPQ